MPVLYNSLGISLYGHNRLLRYFDSHVTDLLFIYIITTYSLLSVQLVQDRQNTGSNRA